MRSYLLVNANKFEIVIIFYILFTFRERTISLKSVKLQFEFETLLFLIFLSFFLSLFIYLIVSYVLHLGCSFPTFYSFQSLPEPFLLRFPSEKSFAFWTIAYFVWFLFLLKIIMILYIRIKILLFWVELCLSTYYI